MPNPFHDYCHVIASVTSCFKSELMLVSAWNTVLMQSNCKPSPAVAIPTVTGGTLVNTLLGLICCLLLLLLLLLRLLLLLLLSSSTRGAAHATQATDATDASGG
jgi:TRAP-type C4-dicarboxylate transport system permease small subunit